MNQGLRFRALDGRFAVVRLNADSPVPAWAQEGQFISVSRSADELSIICPLENLPHETHSPRRWICLKLCGPFPFTQTGVLLSFIQPLSGNDVPIFAVSTFDTDYVLIPEEFSDKALSILKKSGHIKED
jgi:uncharacterized protein